MLFGDASEQDLRANLYAEIDGSGASGPHGPNDGGDDGSAINHVVHSHPHLHGFQAAIVTPLLHDAHHSAATDSSTMHAAATAAAPFHNGNSSSVTMGANTALMYDSPPQANQHAQWMLDMHEVNIVPGSEAQFQRAQRIDAPSGYEDASAHNFATMQRATYRGQQIVLKSFMFPPPPVAETEEDDNDSAAEGGAAAAAAAEQATLMADLVSDLIEASSVPHPNIVRLVGVATSASPSSDDDAASDAAASSAANTTTVYVATEFLPAGSLRALLRTVAASSSSSSSSSSLPPLPPATVLKWALEIALGMESLHSRHQVHGHLSSTHVLLSTPPPPPPSSSAAATAGSASASAVAILPCAAAVAQVSDVGSRRLKAYAEVMLSTRLCDPSYSSPELLRDGSEAASQPADVFAFAIICWELTTRQIPWAGSVQTLSHSSNATAAASQQRETIDD